MSVQFESIPKHWEMKQLGEVCIKISNGANVRQYDDYKIGLPISRIETIWNGTFDFSRVKFVAENASEFVEKYMLRNNDILFSHINSDIHLGKTAIYNLEGKRPLIHGINLLLLRPSEEINADFFNYQLKFFRAKGLFIAAAQKSVNQSSINQAKLKQFKILLPPLPEQAAIVSKIEELFSELDHAKAQLQTALQQLKVYRQSLLKWAFEGRLTHDDVKGGELPVGWKWVKLDTIAIVNPKLPQKSEIQPDIDVQFLPMKLVEEEINKIHLTEIRKFQEVQKGSYTPFINNDIIFAKVTPCMENGKIAVVDNLKNGIGYGSSEFHVIRCSDVVLNHFVFYFLVQEKFRKNAENAMTGAVGLRRVPKQFLEAYEIPLPPKEHQREIVQILENKLTVCDHTEADIRQSLEQAESLRQSILKQAFEGKLITYNPTAP